MPRVERPTKAVGPDVDTMARIVRSRAPLSTDYRRPETNEYYEIGTVWVDSSADEPWIIVDITANSASWVKFAGDTADIISLTGDDAEIVPADTSGNVDIQGKTVANATRVKPVYIEGTVASNLLDVEVQVGAAITGAPADKNDAGLCSFDDTSFSVDANGYVTMATGPGPQADSIDVDFNTAPGTDPVLPTSAGLVSIFGNTVVNGTNANAPVATHSRAANQLHVDVQLATEITGAPADPFDAGICSFDDTAFAVDANGYVTATGVLPTSFPTDSGTAVPAAGSLSVLGGTGISTSGSGSTVTVTLDTPVSVPNGGTGATSLSDGFVLLGSGTGAITALDVTAKGSILVGDGTTDPVALAVGSDTYVLTADSAEASGLKWAATGVGAGTWVLIEQQTVSSPVATVDFESSIDSTYDYYVMFINGVVPVTDIVHLNFRVGTGATPTYQSGATDYEWAQQEDGAGAVSGGTGDSVIRLCTQVGSDTDESGATLQIWVMEPSDTSLLTNVIWHGGFTDNVNGRSCVQGWGKYTSTTAVTAFRFLFSSGNIESGTFSLYGVST